MATPLNAALKPMYGFNGPNEPIELFSGEIGGHGPDNCQGTVAISFSRRPIIEWEVSVPDIRATRRGPLDLVLHRPDGVMPLVGNASDPQRGLSNGSEFGSRNSKLSRAIAHWFNLPDWWCRDLISDTPDDPDTGYQGRWSFEADGWSITFDQRPDLDEVLKHAKRSNLYVMTHVMELRRTDGSEFSADEADAVLESLHTGMSFALGRWAAPMLPVGFARDGSIAWEEWRPLHLDTADSITPGWWYQNDLVSLAEVLRLAIEKFKDPAVRARLGFQMKFSILATGYHGFVESRVINGTAGLEHMQWQYLRLGKILTKEQYKGRAPWNGKTLRAAHRLRMTLDAAQISYDVDPLVLPEVHAFIQRDPNANDGADVVTRIRNRLVHPEAGQEIVYDQPGLLTEVWALARHFLALLVLHSLGFTGQYRDLRKFEGWYGATEQVPWA
ncbi:hypothetical protein [Glycomyces sp. NPDC047010]|uniref:hypothetical protein n=1 Tax=Glycomyces sp. NPDC047010 TaxID=3155023 RepID=UPI0033CC94BA